MIGVLNAYHFDPTPGNYQEEYTRLFLDFVEKIFPGKRAEIKEYKVAQGQFPKSAAECDIWFITGSPKSVYEDIPWINQLIYFTKEIHAKKQKLIGICFGHQMVAHALGGQVTKSRKGWGVGIRTFEIIDHPAWMFPADKKISLIFSHQDQVDLMAPGAIRLATDEFCPNQITQIDKHILTLQGHPEFSMQFAKDRLDSRKDSIPSDTYVKAMNSFEKDNDYKKLINWIRNFLNERDI